jgi:tetratricopeptide (TPR) repeat protein
MWRCSCRQREPRRRAEELAREATQAARRLHLNAAQHFREAADLVSGDDPVLRLNYLVRSAGAYYSYGDAKWEMAVLAKAIEAYREVLTDKACAERPIYYADTQNLLGNALWRIAEREIGTAHLEEAMDAYR